MKFLVLFLAFTSCIIANDSLEIEKNKLFEEAIETKTMQASFSLNGKNKHQNILEHSISKVIDIAKKGGCFGGKYRIHPNYIYDKNIQVMDGYYTQVNFQCEFTNSDIYESVLTEIKKVDTLNLTQGEISYVLSKEMIQNATENLEIKALQYGQKYSELLNDKLDDYKNCMVSKLSFKEENFHNYNANVRTMKMFQTQGESTTVTNPIENKQNVSLRAYYTFKCKLK